MLILRDRMAFSTLRPRPRSGPPSPPTEWYGRGGGGDGDIRFPRIIWLMLALTLIGSAFGLYRIGLGLIERPLPVSAALAAGVVGAWTVRRRSLEAPDLVSGRIILTSILGGVIGEGVHYLMVGIPASVPPQAIWPVLGALGIGGAIGTGVGVVALLTWCTGLLIALIRGWHAA